MTIPALPKLTVIELAGVLAGPAVGTFFAELGAKVIKIENPENSDVTRSWKLPQENTPNNISAYFSAVNYNKQYLNCDLKTTDGLTTLHKLVKHADILVTNFKHPLPEVDYATLASINPQLIYANVSGYEEQNERPAFDVVLQAETGFMSMNGTQDSGPIKMPVALIDIIAAHQLKEAILLALLKRERTQKGSYVTVSLYESAIASLMNQASNWLMEKHIATPTGSLHPNIAPYGETFITADNRLIVLAIGNNKQFNRLCSLLQLEDLTKDQRFTSNQQRVIHRMQLANLLAKPFRTKTGQEWSDLFVQNNVPAGLILDMQEVFDNPVAQNMVIQETINGVLTKRVRSIVFNTDFLTKSDEL